MKDRRPDGCIGRRQIAAYRKMLSVALGDMAALQSKLLQIARTVFYVHQSCKMKYSLVIYVDVRMEEGMPAMCTQLNLAWVVQ